MVIENEVFTTENNVDIEIQYCCESMLLQLRKIDFLGIFRMSSNKIDFLRWAVSVSRVGILSS